MTGIRHTATGLWRSRRGASAMEFAIIILPFMVFIISTLEFARLQWTRAAVQEVAMATARCMGISAVACSDAPTGGATARTFSASKTRTFVTTEAAGWNIGFGSGGSVALAPSTSCQGISGFSKVSLSYTFTSGMLSFAGLSSYPVTAEACFPVQS